MSRDTPVPKDRTVWVYFVSRDSIGGELSGVCHLWYAKPMRTRIGYRVTWVASDDRNPCHLGECALSDLHAWFRVVPETDLELLKIEQYASQKMLDEAKAQRGAG